MNLVTTEAIVLRSYNLAEADRIVLCFTRAAGLIRGVAKGARRMRSRFGAGLEPFTLVRLEFREKENRELVNEFAPPHEANEKLFRMVSACLDALAAAPQISKIVLRYFEVWILRRRS